MQVQAAAKLTHKGPYPTHRQLSVYQDLCYYRHLLELRGAPPNYDLRGLVKRGGTLE